MTETQLFSLIRSKLFVAQTLSFEIPIVGTVSQPGLTTVHLPMIAVLLNHNVVSTIPKCSLGRFARLLAKQFQTAPVSVAHSIPVSYGYSPLDAGIQQAPLLEAHQFLHQRCLV